MSASIIGLCLVAQLCQVGGQLLTKHAMNATNRTPMPWKHVIVRLTSGIILLGMIVCFYAGSLATQWRALSDSEWGETTSSLSAVTYRTL